MYERTSGANFNIYLSFFSPESLCCATCATMYLFIKRPSTVAGYGVLCTHSNPLRLFGNAVHSNRDIGIYVKQKPTVVIASNSITSNKGAGIHACSHSKVANEWLLILQLEYADVKKSKFIYCVRSLDVWCVFCLPVTYALCNDMPTPVCWFKVQKIEGLWQLLHFRSK